MNQINREDMLELTRRMTLKRNCFDRIAGAYLDRDGFVDGTFNKNFRQLSLPDQQKNLDPVFGDECGVEGICLLGGGEKARECVAAALRTAGV